MPKRRFSLSADVIKDIFEGEISDIIRWTEQALTNPKDKDRPTRKGWETSPRALRKTYTGRALERIQVNKVPCKVQYQAGEIASIYPIVPQ